MGYVLFILLVGIPIVEIAVFISVGGIIGFWPTIAIIILTAAIGASLLKKQGLQALLRVDGRLLLFRGTEERNLWRDIQSVRWRGTYPLLESRKSHLVVLEKVLPVADLD